MYHSTHSSDHILATRPPAPPRHCTAENTGPRDKRMPDHRPVLVGVSALWHLLLPQLLRSTIVKRQNADARACVRFADSNTPARTHPLVRKTKQKHLALNSHWPIVLPRGASASHGSSELGWLRPWTCPPLASAQPRQARQCTPLKPPPRSRPGTVAVPARFL